MANNEVFIDLKTGIFKYRAVQTENYLALFSFKTETIHHREKKFVLSSILIKIFKYSCAKGYPFNFFLTTSFCWKNISTL